MADGGATPFGDVVLLASASRSGSSMVADWLRARSSAVHLQGEFETVLREAGAVARTPLHAGESDADIDLADGRSDRVIALLDAALGAPLASDAPLDAQAYARSLYEALERQWPGIDLDHASTQHLTQAIFAGRGWTRAGQFDRWTFLLDVVAALRSTHAGLDPYCYDVAETLVRTRFPSLAPNGAAPDPDCDEDRPFIIPVPWHACASAVRPATVVLKGPSCSYRIGALRTVFGRDRLRILHVVRDPAASINGLIDGWRHRGFQSRHLAEPLDLRGLDQRDQAWTQHWWCFDVPPGWERYRGASLADVCAFQWRSANARILEHAQTAGARYRRVRFEDFLDPGARGLQVRRSLLDWIKPGDGTTAALGLDPRPVMATVPPCRGRWRTRRALLEPVLGEPEVRRVRSALGYTGR